MALNGLRTVAQATLLTGQSDAVPALLLSLV